MRAINNIKKHNLKVTKEIKNEQETMDIEKKCDEIIDYFLINNSLHEKFSIDKFSKTFKISHRHAEQCSKLLLEKCIISEKYLCSFKGITETYFWIYIDDYIRNYIKNNINDIHRTNVLNRVVKFSALLYDLLKSDYELSDIERKQLLKELVYSPLYGMDFINEYCAEDQKKLIQNISSDYTCAYKFLLSNPPTSQRGKAFTKVLNSNCKTDLVNVKLIRSEKERLIKVALKDKNFELAEAIVIHCKKPTVNAKLQYKLENFVLIRKMIGEL